MTLRRFRPLSPLTMFGLCALAFANMSNMLVRRYTTLSEGLTDPVFGFCAGVGIAATLFGVWRQGRGMRGQNGCA